MEDDATYNQNSDLITGLEFHATLQLRTPLSILNHHGEIFDGPPSAAPQYGGPADGIWIYKTKTWEELAIESGGDASIAKRLDDLSGDADSASDIGPVKPATYLPFLKAFRTIVEGGFSQEKKIELLLNLPDQSPAFDEMWARLLKNDERFPHSWMSSELAHRLGIGGQMAWSLYQMGLHSAEAVWSLSDADMLRIPGLGVKTLSKIRSSQSSAKTI